MALENLIDDGEPEPRAAGKTRLERLENSCAFLGIEAHSRVADRNAHPIRGRVEADREHAALRHGAQSVVAKIPKNLLHGVAIGTRTNIPGGEVALDLIFATGAGVSLEEQQRFFDQGDDFDVGEGISLLARIVEKLGDDLIQALRFAADDLNELLVVVFERREARQFLQRARHGRQRLPNFVRDRGGKPAERGHVLFGDDFPFEALQFRQVLEIENEAGGLVLTGAQRRNRKPQETDGALRRLEFHFLAQVRAEFPARPFRRAKNLGNVSFMFSPRSRPNPWPVISAPARFSRRMRPSRSVVSRPPRMESMMS